MTTTMIAPLPDPTGPADQVGPLLASITAVRQLLAAGLLDPAALGLPGPAPAAAAAPAALVPGSRIRVADLVAKTLAGLRPNTRRTYRTYLELLADGDPGGDGVEPYPGLGQRFADEVLPSDLTAALAWVRRRATARAAGRAAVRAARGRYGRGSDGAGAVYNAVGAFRALFAVAVADRHLARGFDPAQALRKPPRGTGTRRPLERTEMNQLWAIIGGTGNDPELDELLCWTILIAGARREGLLNLTLGGLDRQECTVLLIEKGRHGAKKRVHQPVPDWFVADLHAFATARGATHPDDPVFRTRGTASQAPAPITARRLDYLFGRIQAALPWADKAQVTAHTLRHHAIAVIQDASRYAVSQAFARHEPETTHDRYGRATPREVAQAVVDVYGGDHPWLHRHSEE